MPIMPPVFRPNGVRTKRERDRAADARRGSARARGYDSRWDKAARGHRLRHPLCRYCEVGAWGDAPRVTPAALTDHLYPHRRFAGVFWLKIFWVSSCSDCHDGPKQAIERQGRTALDALARLLGLPTLAEAQGEGVGQTPPPRRHGPAG